MAKLKSTAVKVYPTAFRGPSSGATKYNPESRLNTEFNVTNFINRLSSKDNFVIDWNSGSKIIKFNIHGYYFESNLTEFLGVGGAGAAWTNIYASIKLLPFTTDEGEPTNPNTKYKAFTLVGTEDSGTTVSSSGRILDVDSSGTFIFEGVDLHQTAINPPAGTDVYELHLLSGGPSAWAVPLNSRLKFLATDVEGLPTINNSTTLKTDNTIFAPTTAGTAGQLSVSQGGTSAPTWISTADVVVGEASQAVQLKSSRNLWGRPFNGTAAISGAITGTGSITPTTTNTSNIGASDNVYANVFATTFTGNLTGNVTGSVSGNAGTVTNGVYTTGDQTIEGTKTFSSTISGSINGNAATVTNGVVTTGSYSDPSWLTISKSKVGLGNVENTALSTWTGTNTIATVGTITSGTWTGTAIALANGGTGATDAPTARTNLGLGSMSTQASSNVSITGGSVTGITDITIADGGTGASTAAAARTNLGLGSVENTAISTWAGSSNLTTLGTVTTGTWNATTIALANGGTGATTAANARTNLGLGTLSTQASNNVSITGGSISGITDLAVADGGTGASTAADARTNLGLGTISTQASSNVSITGGSITGITDLTVADGGTGASTAADARTNLGLGNVNNTTDANKPVSTATQTALDLKANIASPTFTGSPAAPTATIENDSTLIATTQFVRRAVRNHTNSYVLKHDSTAYGYTNLVQSINHTFPFSSTMELTLKQATWYRVSFFGVYSRASGSTSTMKLGLGFISSTSSASIILSGRYAGTTAATSLSLSSIISTAAIADANMTGPTFATSSVSFAVAEAVIEFEAVVYTGSATGIRPMFGVSSGGGGSSFFKAGTTLTAVEIAAP
jgi:hypothetical protein